MCDAQTLGALRSAKFHVTTLLPKTFSMWNELAEQALGSGMEWEEVERREGRTKKDPERVQRGCVLPCKMKLEKEEDGKKVQWEEPFRAVVMESSELKRTQAETQAEQVEKQRKKLEQQIAEAGRREYAHPEVAAEAAEQWKKGHKSPWWRLRAEVVSEVKRLRRGRRGRPKAGEGTPEVTVYRMRITVEAHEEARQEAARRHGLYILMSSHTEYTAAAIWADYRGQQEVERGFRWLKAPGQLAPVFLHTPSRVAALGFVFTLALLLYRLMQWQLRSNLEKTNTTIPGHHGRPTQKPTMAFVMNYFRNINVVHMETNAGNIRVVVGLLDIHHQVMKLLGVPPEVYSGNRMPQNK